MNNIDSQYIFKQCSLFINVVIKQCCTVTLNLTADKNSFDGRKCTNWETSTIALDRLKQIYFSLDEVANQLEAKPTSP